MTFVEYLDRHPTAVHVILQHGTNAQPSCRYFDFLGPDNLIIVEPSEDPSAEEVLNHDFKVVEREKADWVMCLVDGYQGKAILDETTVWCTW